MVGALIGSEVAHFGLWKGLLAGVLITLVVVCIAAILTLFYRWGLGGGDES